MVYTRPGIAQTMRVVSRYMSNLGKENWRVVKWVFRYLKESSEITLCYDSTDVRLHRYTDSDFVGDVVSQKSTTDYFFTMESEAVSWGSRLQKIVALSTREVEYVAATETCKELIWLIDFMKELDKEKVTPSLHSDSQSVIDLTNNPIYHDRTKHIDVRYHFISILLKDNVLSLVKIHTSQNPTDILTKVVMTEKLKTCSSSVGLLR